MSDYRNYKLRHTLLIEQEMSCSMRENLISFREGWGFQNLILIIKVLDTRMFNIYETRTQAPTVNLLNTLMLWDKMLQNVNLNDKFPRNNFLNAEVYKIP